MGLFVRCHRKLIVLMLVCAGSIGGCVNVVDTYMEYVVRGKLLSANTESPLREVNVAVGFKAFDPSVEHPDYWSGFAFSDDDGKFEVSVTGEVWGHTLIFGVIPLGDTEPPVPEKKVRVLIYVKCKDSWHQISVPLEDAMWFQEEPGRRWVDIGNVRVPVPCPSRKLHPG